jgi:hypothetical protein
MTPAAISSQGYSGMLDELQNHNDEDDDNQQTN